MAFSLCCAHLTDGTDSRTAQQMAASASRVNGPDSPHKCRRCRVARQPDIPACGCAAAQAVIGYFEKICSSRFSALSTAWSGAMPPRVISAHATFQLWSAMTSA